MSNVNPAAACINRQTPLMTITPDDAIDRDIYEFAQVLFAMLTGITTGVLPKNERLRQEWAKKPKSPDEAVAKATRRQSDRSLVGSISLPAGSRLGSYTIEAELGQGQQGKVYAAHDSQLNRVALKVRFAQLPPTQEASVLQRLHHPHIRAYYGSGEENGLCYLVLEYLEGQLLAKRLEQGPLPVDEALEYARQIADALSALHRAGWTHGELRLWHIMLTESGAKLFDFSKARDEGARKRRQAEKQRRVAVRASREAARQERLAAQAIARSLKAARTRLGQTEKQRRVAARASREAARQERLAAQAIARSLKATKRRRQQLRARLLRLLLWPLSAARRIPRP